MAGDARRRGTRLCTLLAALAYLGLAAWNFRAALPSPTTLLPENPRVEGAFTHLGRLDQAMVLGVVTGHAHRLLHRPSALREEGQCHPLAHAYTLGEHMWGTGLLVALPLLVGGDPILAYNLMLVATLWIPGLAMYLLALHLTRSPPAAFVAGVLFALEPGRIQDAGHPFIHGDLWAPLALLFLHRVFARGGLADTALCALFLCLGLLESLYAVLATLLVFVAYGAFAAYAHRRQVRRWLAPLLCCVLAAAATAWLVLAPYLAAREAFAALVRTGTIFMPLESYVPGAHAFPGWAMLLLVVAGIADRLRGPRREEGEDPRLAYLAGGVLVLWASVRTLPLLGIDVPSPFLLAKRVLPGLDAVRALASVGRGAALAFAPIAAYGVVALTERLGRRAAIALSAVLSLGIAAERWVPALATRSFGSTLGLAAHPARPPAEDIALVRAQGTQGALLVLPVPSGGRAGDQLRSADDLLLGSYSPRPTASCYNSYPSPLQRRLAELANALPDARAADALAALGFSTVLLRADRTFPRGLERFAQRVASDPAIGARLEPNGHTDRILAFRLASPTPAAADLELLDADGAVPLPHAAPGRVRVAIRFINRSGRTFRHPDPIAPRAIEAHWVSAQGEVLHRERALMVLPLALAPGAGALAEIELAPPPRPGRNELVLALVDAPDREIARVGVDLADPGGG